MNTQPPTARELAARLERIIAANHDEAITIPEEELETPIVSLGIGSLDLIEWAFEIEAEYELELGDDELAQVAAFSFVDTERWLAEHLGSRVPS
jgi:acyl carrier protein